MPKITYQFNTFEYFKRLKPSIVEGTVLDYGSNYSPFLNYSNGEFPKENYVGLDVDLESIRHGEKLFPSAKFIWYNGYNSIYNPKGTSDLPVLNKKFNTIISYSVITHTSIEDMIKKVDWLYDQLDINGSMLVSWLDLNQRISKYKFYTKRVEQFGSCDIIQGKNYVYLNDNKISNMVDNRANFLLLFLEKDYLSNIFSKYKPRFVDPMYDIENCLQSCMIIQK